MCPNSLPIIVSNDIECTKKTKVNSFITAIELQASASNKHWINPSLQTNNSCSTAEHTYNKTNQLYLSFTSNRGTCYIRVNMMMTLHFSYLNTTKQTWDKYTHSGHNVQVGNILKKTLVYYCCCTQPFHTSKCKASNLKFKLIQYHDQTPSSKVLVINIFDKTFNISRGINKNKRNGANIWNYDNVALLSLVLTIITNRDSKWWENNLRG